MTRIGFTLNLENDVFFFILLGLATMSFVAMLAIHFKLIWFSQYWNFQLGANAILAMSLVVCKAGAAVKKIPLYKVCEFFLLCSWWVVFTLFQGLLQSVEGWIWCNRMLFWQYHYVLWLKVTKYHFAKNLFPVQVNICETQVIV